MNFVRNSGQNVGVVGLGYVGLPVALLAAKSGFDVFGVDTNSAHVDALRTGQSRIKEPGLHILLTRMLDRCKIEFVQQPQTCDFFIIAVPTPVTEQRKADLSYVVAAAESIAPVLRRGNLVMVESTVSPGCCRTVVLPILERSGLVCGRDFYLAYCPERVLPGNALHEIVHNARIIGGYTPLCSTLAKEFYASFVQGTIHVTGIEEAELTKLTENAYRDVNIAFANEIANVCEHLGVDPREVIGLANAHPRVNVLNPGPGVGGHCIAVDPWFLIEAYPGTPLMRAAREVNNLRPGRVVDQVLQHFGRVGGQQLLILGLSYKADVGDLRESPALEIAISLAEAGFDITAVDPHVEGDEHGPITMSVRELGTLAEEADGILLLVDHQEFRSLDWHSLLARMKGNLFLDTRGISPASAPTPTAHGNLAKRKPLSTVTYCAPLSASIAR